MNVQWNRSRCRLTWNRQVFRPSRQCAVLMANRCRQGIQRAAKMQKVFVVQQREQNKMLEQAQNSTLAVLATLTRTATASDDLASIMAGRLSWSSPLWSYIWCPVVSLMLGSYGLPPSAPRNLALLAAGKSLLFYNFVLHKKI
jgi:hypothetical protein